MTTNIRQIFELAEQVEKRKSEKLQKLMELMADPDLSHYIAQWGSFLRNGHPPEPEKRSFSPPPGFKYGNGIRDAVRALTLPQQFTATDVLNALEGTNFRFSARDRKGAIRDVLYELARGDSPEFKIVREGAGGKPNYYQRV
jgi:hypothetical protein